MGGGKGKKDVNAKRKTNFLKHGKIRNSTSLTNLKQAFFKKSTGFDAKQTITDAKPPGQHSCTGLTLDGVQRGTCTCTLEKT